MAVLTGTPSTVSLGEGYGIRAPGVTGQATLQRPRPAGARSASRSDVDGTEILDRALEATDTVEVRQVELRVRPIAGAAPAAPLRSVDGNDDAIELQVPDLGPDTGQLVLSCDEAGALSWHLPVNAAGEPAGAARGSGGVKRFLIPATPRPVVSDEQARSRSLLGIAGRKLLKVLVYPITDPIIGFIGDQIAARWEAAKRPYGIRRFTPADFRQPSSAPLTAADWTRLASGRSLLFVHGTFSTAHGAFGQMDDATFDSLYRKYDGRVFAFNHFTLSEDPRQNVTWLLRNLPRDIALRSDIICHSRGGLVARVLAGHRVDTGHTSAIAVDRVVFVGVPNQGTLLAHPDHMVKMIDRLTTMLNVLPSGFAAEILEGLITAVKTIGHGALKGLDGLRSMEPEGEFLTWLNTPAASKLEFYGISSNYEPLDEGLKALVRRSVNAAMDTVFEQTANDLVVPEAGVHSANGDSTHFPLDPSRILSIETTAGVAHSGFFAHPAAAKKLQEWLAR